MDLHAQTLYVKQKVGLQNTFFTDDVQKITFSGGQMSIVQTNGSSSGYALSDVRYLSFRNYITPITTDIDAFIQADLISVYPNPAKDVLYIKHVNTVQVDIINAIGELVLSQTADSNTAVNVAGLSQGIYICRISQNGQQFFNRFIKE